MNKHVKFETLRQFLKDMGFEEREGKGEFGQKGFLFEHEESGTLFLFRKYEPEEDVAMRDLASVRFFLNANGLMERYDFERWTWQEAAA